MSQIGGTGGASGQIGHLFVQFSQQGAQALQQGVAAVGQQMAQMGQQAAQVGQQMGQQFAALGAGAQALGRSMTASMGRAWDYLAKEAKWTGVGMADMFRGVGTAAQGLAGALSGVTGPLHGMVMQGIAASSMGQVMSMQFREINRQLASVFVPTVNAVSQGLAGVVRWFQSLGGEGQAGLRALGLSVLTLTTMATIMPRVVAGFQSLAIAMKGVQAAAIGATMLNPWLALATVLGGLVGGMMLLDSKEQALKGATASVGGVADATSEAFKALGDAVKEAAGGIKEAVQPLADVMSRAFGFKSGSEQGLSSTQALYKGLREWSLRRFVDVEIGSKGLLGNSWLGQAASWTNAKVFGPDAPGMLGLDRLFGFNYGTKQKGRTDASAPLGGMEDVPATWRRLALTSRNIGQVRDKTDQERLLDEVKEIKQSIKEAKEGLDELKGRRPVSTR